MISSRTHGILDYLTGILLILAPSLFGFADTGAASQVPILLGVGTILYSLMTRYEFGLLKLIPLRAHLGLDLFAGIFLAVSPWLLGFADIIWWPHLLVGIFEIGASLMTRRDAELAHAGRGHHPHRGAAAR